jgi:hypothetical protein
VNNTKVLGEMINVMVRAHYLVLMVKITLVNGKITKKMGKAHKLGQMEVNTKVSIKIT